MVATHYGKKSKNKLQGKLRQKTKGGNYYYRLMITNGTRKEFALGTANYDEAVQKASELDSVWLAPTKEVALAQMNAICGFSRQIQKISFEEAWEKYQVHPDRATPHTVEGRLGYQKSFELFRRFASGEIGKKRAFRATAVFICQVTSRLCEDFSDYLRTLHYAVHTHNRKIKHLRRIF